MRSHLEMLECLDPYPNGEVLTSEVRSEGEQRPVRRLEVEARDRRAFLDLVGDPEGGESGPWCGSSDFRLELDEQASEVPVCLRYVPHQ